jgi:tripartite-type tricarboxylate transporter receptor subunit TctC
MPLSWVMTTMGKRFLVTAIAAFWCLSALAADYPTHPITFIVPFAAGGPTDTLGRMLAERMSGILGQIIVIENTAGAGGSVGVGRAVHAAPDGYTISVGNWSTHVLNGAIYPLGYDLIADLEPVALLPSGLQLIVARKNLPAGNLGELISWLKRNQATVGTAGVGSAGHVSALFFQKETGSQLTFVHYRGAGPAMIDLVGGHIDVMFDQSANSLPHVRDGAIKSYAVTNRERLVSAPDIPTVDEAGLPNFHIAVWHGLWAPRGTPESVIAKLNSAARAALQDPALRERLSALGWAFPLPDQTSPAALGAVQKADIAKWWPILKSANVKAE